MERYSIKKRVDSSYVVERATREEPLTDSTERSTLLPNIVALDGSTIIISIHSRSEMHCCPGFRKTLINQEALVVIHWRTWSARKGITFLTLSLIYKRSNTSTTYVLEANVAPLRRVPGDIFLFDAYRRARHCSKGI